MLLTTTCTHTYKKYFTKTDGLFCYMHIKEGFLPYTSRSLDRNLIKARQTYVLCANLKFGNIRQGLFLAAPRAEKLYNMIIWRSLQDICKIQITSLISVDLSRLLSSNLARTILVSFKRWPRVAGNSVELGLMGILSAMPPVKSLSPSRLVPYFKASYDPWSLERLHVPLGN